MNKDLRKVVILLAHPNIKESQANKALVDAVSDMEGVAVFNLYELSQEIAFNIDEWSKKYPSYSEAGHSRRAGCPNP